MKITYTHVDTAPKCSFVSSFKIAKATA